jgi:hypothetical protein
MQPLKNLAGHDVSIFLFRFDLRGNSGIDFILNETIAADMYADVDKQLKPFVQACGEALLRYKRWSVSDTIMDGNILFTGEFEVMLSRGLGKYIPEAEKEQLFADAGAIGNLLTAVMDRRTREEQEGKPTPPFRKPAAASSTEVKRGLEKLGYSKRLAAELMAVAEGKPIRRGRKRLRPEDLPPGVEAVMGYDHRGHCVTITHETLGELGRIVTTDLPDKETLIRSELCLGQESLDSPRIKEKQRLFGEVVAIVTRGLEGKFPE